METKDDLRILRARVEDMERRISIISRQAGSTAAHLIGEVVDKGNMPTSLPGVFAVHPTSISADAVENSVPTLTSEDVDGIAFVVLGSRAPKAGYHLVGNLVDGRWVAEVSSKICNFTDNAKISVNLYRCGNLSLKIAGATVNVELWDEEAEEWTLVGTDVTDSNGDGEVPITEEGRYRLTLTHVSYAPFIYETDAVCGGNNTFFAIDDTVRLIVKGCTVFSRPVSNARMTVTFTGTGHVYTGIVPPEPADYWDHAFNYPYAMNAVTYAPESGPCHVVIEAERFEVWEGWLIKAVCGGFLSFDPAFYAPNTSIPMPSAGTAQLIPTSSYICPFWANPYGGGSYNANGAYSISYPISKTLQWADPLLGNVTLTYDEISTRWKGTGSGSAWAGCGGAGTTYTFNVDYGFIWSNGGIALTVTESAGSPGGGGTVFFMAPPHNYPIQYNGHPPPGFIAECNDDFFVSGRSGIYACIPVGVRLTYPPQYQSFDGWLGWLSEL
jgi:hypothetical protein